MQMLSAQRQRLAAKRMHSDVMQSMWPEEQQQAEEKLEAVQTTQQWERSRSSTRRRSVGDGATHMMSDAREKTFPLTTPTTLAVNHARRVRIRSKRGARDGQIGCLSSQRPRVNAWSGSCYAQDGHTGTATVELDTPGAHVETADGGVGGGGDYAR